MNAQKNDQFPRATVHPPARTQRRPQHALARRPDVRRKLTVPVAADRSVKAKIPRRGERQCGHVSIVATQTAISFRARSVSGDEKQESRKTKKQQIRNRELRKSGRGSGPRMNTDKHGSENGNTNFR